MPLMTDKNLIKSRNQLLQEALRPEILPYTIDKEYPLVLNENELQYSFILTSNDNVISHLNLLPRIIKNTTTQKEISVGLIGNVATAKNFQGQGLMKKLIFEAEQYSHQNNLQALILWSDLHQFYQKLGFSSFGQEKHFYIDRQKILQSSLISANISIFNHSLTESTFKQIMKLRYPTSCTIIRTRDEFNKLLKIPDTYLITIELANTLIGYFIIGRGYDMAGVIHEWGAQSPSILLAAIKSLLSELNVNQCILLSPNPLNHDWYQQFKKFSNKIEDHYVALVKFISNDHIVKETLNNSFVWGMDSI